MVLTPLDSMAGLNEPDAVWPLTTGSVSTISKVARWGISMEMALKYGEPDIVVKAVGYHHHDPTADNLYAVLVMAADAISGARPGARRESIENYVKRLEALEKIANSFPGVERSFAIQAGREVRIMVEPKVVDDARAYQLANDVARRVERELQYPGQIKVVAIRETRAVEAPTHKAPAPSPGMKPLELAPVSSRSSRS